MYYTIYLRPLRDKSGASKCHVWVSKTQTSSQVIHIYSSIKTLRPTRVPAETFVFAPGASSDLTRRTPVAMEGMLERAFVSHY